VNALLKSEQDFVIKLPLTRKDDSLGLLLHILEQVGAIPESMLIEVQRFQDIGTPLKRGMLSWLF
jgi:hypothetical protein